MILNHSLHKFTFFVVAKIDIGVEPGQIGVKLLPTKPFTRWADSNKEQ